MQPFGGLDARYQISAVADSTYKRADRGRPSRGRGGRGQGLAGPSAHECGVEQARGTAGSQVPTEHAGVTCIGIE